MTQTPTSTAAPIRALIAAAALAVCCGAAIAAAPPAKPAKASAAKKKPSTVVLPEATPEQLDAAQRVYYGRYECEFNQSLDIDADRKYPGYVDVKHGRKLYRMKPVLSSTGAIRLEDVKGEALMVQIANKSMLLNVKSGHRVVDDCVSPTQREFIAAAAKAKAAEAAASAASQ
jgi:hypothetical protein